MKLIVEKTRDQVKQRDGRRPFSLHIYTETDEHFRKVQRFRSAELKRLSPKVLDRQCDFAQLKGEWHMVFEVAEPKRRKRGRS